MGSSGDSALGRQSPATSSSLPVRLRRSFSCFTKEEKHSFSLTHSPATSSSLPVHFQHSFACFKARKDCFQMHSPAKSNFLPKCLQRLFSCLMNASRRNVLFTTSVHA
eukprot:scaffold57479_cov19-Tisochrysis_lutea.AAC.1